MSIKNSINEVKAGEIGYGLLIENDGYMQGDSDTINQIKDDMRSRKEFIIPDRFVVSAIFQKFGLKNTNGRIYPEAILKREVEKYISNRVATRSAIGAGDHPSSSELSVHDVSHVITNLEWVNNTLIGEMELHLSPGYRRYGVISTSGDRVANLLMDNIMIGVSSRGLGSVENKYGDTIVCDDFDLICWDVVVDPSTKGAYIGSSRKELERFIESKQNTHSKSVVNESLLRVKNILS